MKTIFEHICGTPTSIRLDTMFIAVKKIKEYEERDLIKKFFKIYDALCFKSIEG